jgi:hypothetical protein
MNIRKGLRMLFTKSTFLGIDPTAGEKPFSYAAIDKDLGLLALGHGGMEDILAFVAGQEKSYTAICAPRRLNCGLMSQAEIRQRLSPQPNPGRWLDFRLADYLLRCRNIHVPRTPSIDIQCPNWMRVGFSLYSRLEGLGYKKYLDDTADRQLLEVYPYASYAVMIGVLPLNKYTFEGRLQRHLALFEHGLNVKDPMRIFEEITRHKLLKGILPMDQIYTSGELDALVAAYTAWCAATKPHEVTLIGDEDEGQVVIPEINIKNKYEGCRYYC